MQDLPENLINANSPHPTLSSTELLELIAVRQSLTALIDYILQMLDVVRQTGALRPVTAVADEEVIALINDLTDRRARLELRLSTVEQLAGIQ